jgi:hypothetical protein
LASCGPPAQSSPITTTILDSHLPARDWTGATIHQWGQTNWTAQTGVVTASTTGQITFTTSSNNCPQICATAGTRYYLDAPPGVGPLAAGQWSYDGAAHQLSVWMPAGDSPQAHSLEAKQRTWAFDLSGVSHVTLSHLVLWAASITTTQSSSYDTLDGITATYLSHYEDLPAPVLKWRPSDPPQGNSNPRFAHVLDSGIVLSGTHHLLENSVISESAGNGVVVWGGYITVTNNLIHDTDYGGSYAAPIHIARPLAPVTPDPLWITHNTLYNTARDGINDDYAWTVNAGPTTISQNDVWTYGVLNNDLGGIRDCCQVDGTGAVVTQNWVHDQATPTCVACYAGTGIYLDNGPRRWTADAQRGVEHADERHHRQHGRRERRGQRGDNHQHHQQYPAAHGGYGLRFGQRPLAAGHHADQQHFHRHRPGADVGGLYLHHQPDHDAGGGRVCESGEPGLPAGPGIAGHRLRLAGHRHHARGCGAPGRGRL